MNKYLLLLILLISTLLSNEIKVASYNVQNLFDLSYDKTEYKEYIPNTKTNWNKTTYNKKIKNISKVIKDLNSHIIALQEIESKKILKELQKQNPKYKYISFAKYKNSSVGLGFLSTIKILNSKKIKVKFSNKIFRPILQTTFIFKNHKFKIFNNHWPSKNVAESYRIKYAYTLIQELEKLPKDSEYILLGDFNSNYNEFETFFNNDKLNNSSFITGINDIINTKVDNKLINKNKRYKQKVHYNLWLELPYNERFSYLYRGKNSTPDNIIIPLSLLDEKNISYKNNSFEVFKAKYLYKNNKINKWQKKKQKHLGKGYSDHLPISAIFTLNKFEKDDKKIENISHLYEISNLKKATIFDDLVAIYTTNEIAILKQKNDKAILFYKKNHAFKENYSYKIKINDIKEYQGLKEVVDFKILEEKAKIKNIQNYFINFENQEIKKYKYQNEILLNISGIYKNRYLYFKDKKIRVYFKNKNLIPKNNSKLFIKKAHISFYRSNAQLVIYKARDFKTLN